MCMYMIVEYFWQIWEREGGEGRRGGKAKKKREGGEGEERGKEDATPRTHFYGSYHQVLELSNACEPCLY